MTYDQIALVPRYFDGHSRSDLDVETEFLGYTFKLPVVPANMSSVVGVDTCRYLANNGYFYIMHRFFHEDSGWIKFVRTANMENWPIVSVSVGVSNDELALIKRVIDEQLRIDFVTIDIAHGHCALMQRAIEFIKKTMPDVKIIAGNVCTADGAFDLYKWGADCVKVGIAQGGACSTYGKTGFGLGMPETLDTIFSRGEIFPIIADGGVRNNGDVAKAIALAGESMRYAHINGGGKELLYYPPVLVMAGSIFAACTDSPTFENEAGEKLYYGSASRTQKGHSKNVEGFEVWIPNNGMTLEEKLEEMKQDLQSAISYSGGTNLESLKTVAHSFSG